MVSRPSGDESPARSNGYSKSPNLDFTLPNTISCAPRSGLFLPADLGWVAAGSDDLRFLADG